MLNQLRRETERIHDSGGGNIRVHPNGFIQLDLEPVEESWHKSHKRGHSGASRRLHIWNPPGIELPHQKTVNEIHDHVFDMRSTLIRGRLIQKLYWFVIGAAEEATHELYRAVYAKNSDSRLEATGILGVIKLAQAYPIFADDGYTGFYNQQAFTFHDSDPGNGLVVTVMEKTKIHDGDASVLCPIETPPDNSFDRASAAPTEELWEAVFRSLT